MEGSLEGERRKGRGEIYSGGKNEVNVTAEEAYKGTISGTHVSMHLDKLPWRWPHPLRLTGSWEHCREGT